MTYLKYQGGIANTSNETASNNRINRVDLSVNTPITILVVFGCCYVLGGTIYMWVAHASILAGMVTGFFIGLPFAGVARLALWLRNALSDSNTRIAVNNATQLQAQHKTRVLVENDNYTVYLDNDDNPVFQATVSLTEHRHYPPPEIEAPKLDATEGILATWDGGAASGREVHRWINKDLPKDEQISYRRVVEVLNAYRRGWNERSTTKPKSVESEQEDDEV